jgi:hypothetical protein
MPFPDNAHALVGGVANYRNLPPLPQTVLKDAQEIASLLGELQYCGYPRRHVQLLLDEEATLAAIRRAFADLLRMRVNSQVINRQPATLPAST